MFRTPLTLFRTLAFAEAVSWTLLITGLILRATAGLDVAVSIGGGIHGFVFLSYAATAVVVAKNNRWRPWPTAVAVVSAVIPYATIPAEIWLKRTGRLAGQWRVAETGDPREQAWHDRFFRTLLRHPLLFGLALAVGVAVVFAVLLIIGPPGR
ncbi:DUF3817 domain-containing protein [Microbacterium jiangjiandongii]|uniref:DUF3817 domain-containing protein n=1 Tax=Microbacterium jiangjiandongii TaxID=3049071 RepID=UPI00214B48D7|nr:DUF3817 domain-containing protein [Microbacterium sp. zg.Y843]MCR2817128.1 DUF3817 domain-containing protein [Microbacterium sp. zg.Y843]